MALQQKKLILSCMLLACLETSIAMRIQKSAVAEQEKSKWCFFSHSRELKDYYFEGMFDLPESEDHTALQLWRAPENPILRIHKVTQWVVRSPPKVPDTDENADLPWISDVKDPGMMQWLPACMKPEGQAGCKEQDVVEIELLKVAHIEMTSEINVTDPNTGKVLPEMGLKIVFPDGSKTEFVGGLYLPRSLMASAMKRAETEYGKFSGLGQEARESASEADNMAHAAWGAWKDYFVGSTKATVGAGASAGMGLGAAALVAGVPLYGLFGATSALGTLLAGAGAGLAGGASVGLAIGAVFGTVVGGGAALWDFHKQKEEMGLSAVEKMWEKLACHEKFVHCSKTLIVPKGTTCPEA